MNNQKKVFTSIDDFRNYLRQNIVGHNPCVEINDFIFQFDFNIPIKINQANTKDRNIQNQLTSCKYVFSNCSFEALTNVRESRQEIVFQDNCSFKSVKVFKRTQNTTFNSSVIKHLDVSESKFGGNNTVLGKLRIKNSNVYNTNFKNATFYALVDFYNTTFHENIIFYKTDFLNIVVLSASVFKKNLLFTYTLLNDKVIMRSTTFEKGFDFSLSIIKGHLAIFDLRHSFKSFKTVNKFNDETEYEYAVSKTGIIPLRNKLETYRLLKVEFDKQQNISESLNFRLYEKRTYKDVLRTRKLTLGRMFDQLTLWLNGISNNHGSSYSRAFFFVIIVGWIFFYFSLIGTYSYEFSADFEEWKFKEGLTYFVQYLLPTHKFNYLGEDIKLSPAFYLFDFGGRVFVGYGIYQFIQAFRKFK